MATAPDHFHIGLTDPEGTNDPVRPSSKYCGVHLKLSQVHLKYQSCQCMCQQMTLEGV